MLGFCVEGLRVIAKSFLFSGWAAVTVRLVEVASGKVKYTGEVTVRSGKPMCTGGLPEMHAEVLKHIVDQFTDLIRGRF